MQTIWNIMQIKCKLNSTQNPEPKTQTQDKEINKESALS